MLIRRSVSDQTELAYYLAYTPAYYICSLTDLVKAAGTRWAVEDDFQDAKGTVGLDQTQVRTYRAWKRHATLAIAAYALLAATTAIARRAHPAPVLPEDASQAAPANCGMIALTVPELQRLIPLILAGRPRQTAFHLRWSDWRRRRQARARWHHYHRRLRLVA